jgi:hypothetical protein
MAMSFAQALDYDPVMTTYERENTLVLDVERLKLRGQALEGKQ